MLDVLAAAGTARLEDAGLNEYHAEPLVRAHLGDVDPIALQRSDYRAYWRMFREAMIAWAEDRLADPPETWQAFGDRVVGALQDAARDTGRDDTVLVVSSGGAICRGLGMLLSSSPASVIEMNLQFRNTGFCELIASRQGLRVVSVNRIPHLDHPDRLHAITAA